MAQIVVELKHGLQVGGTLHKRITLRTLTIGESLAAVEAAERLVPTPNGYQLLASNARLTFYNILKMATITDDPDLTITETILKQLQGEDFDLLMEASANIDRAENRAMEIEAGGRN